MDEVLGLLANHDISWLYMIGIDSAMRLAYGLEMIYLGNRKMLDANFNFSNNFYKVFIYMEECFLY